MQPVTAYSTMALFTAAWFKLHLEDTPFDMGIDWDNLIFGNTSDSLCGGGRWCNANLRDYSRRVSAWKLAEG